MYARPCPFCGANLDPGEHCDCREKTKENEILFAEVLKTEKDGQMILREVLERGAYTRIR